MVNSETKKHLRHCSFCGKDENECKKLIAGPTVFICDECVSLCTDIILQADHGYMANVTGALRHHLEKRHGKNYLSERS